MISSTAVKPPVALYRTLLRTARHFDRNPALKALLTRQNIKNVYDSKADKWVELRADKLEVANALATGQMVPVLSRGEQQFKDYMTDKLDKWLCQLLSDGAHYRPEVRLVPIIKREFRSELDWGETAAARQSAGFAALRLLLDALATGRTLQVEPGDNPHFQDGFVELPDLRNALREDAAEVPVALSSDLKSTSFSPVSSQSVVPTLLPGSTFLVSNFSWTVKGGGAPVILMISETQGLVLNQPLFSLSQLVSALSPRMGQREVLQHLFAKTGLERFGLGKLDSSNIGLTRPDAGEEGEGRKDIIWEDVEVFAGNRVFQGGPISDGHLLMLHTFADLPGAEKLGNSDIYIGGSVRNAAHFVREGRALPHHFKLVFGSAAWTKNQLHGEILRNFWYVAESSDPSTTRLALASPEQDESFARFRKAALGDTSALVSPINEDVNQNALFARYMWRSAVGSLGGEFAAIADAPFSLMPSGREPVAAAPA